MKILVPMAGNSKRFLDAGYTLPKVLLDAAGRRVIEYVCDMFNPDDEVIFICNEQQIKDNSMREVLEGLWPGCTVLVDPHPGDGPVASLLPSLDWLDDDEPVIVSYCDNPLIWDRAHFDSYVVDNRLDGCILTHTGFHPHSLAGTKMAFCRVDGKKLLEIQEKKSYTDNHFEEHGVTGVFYFRTGEILKTSIKQMLDSQERSHGEFHVTMLFNYLVQRGLDVEVYDTEFVTVFGTPEELANFQAWHTILNGGQARNPEEAAKCYDYWSRYFARGK